MSKIKWLGRVVVEAIIAAGALKLFLWLVAAVSTVVFAIFAYDTGVHWYWLIFLSALTLYALVGAVNQISLVIERYRQTPSSSKKAEVAQPTEQTEIEKALIQSRADFNNLQQQYTKLSEGVGGKRQQLKEETRKYFDMRSQKESVEKALAEKESEISSLKRVDIQNDLYVTVRARFDKLTNDNSLSFQVHVFNGSLRRFSIECDVFQNNVKGFILVGDSPLPTKPMLKGVTQFEPPSRLTVLTIEQQLTPEIAKSFQDAIDGGFFLQFLFTELDIYMTVDGSTERRRLPLPGGIDCQRGICSNRIIVGKANWTLPGKQ
jgi:hypothetical protein